jgi:hypothetical protein
MRASTALRERKAASLRPGSETRLVDRVLQLAAAREALLAQGSIELAREALRQMRYLEFIHEVCEVDAAS